MENKIKKSVWNYVSESDLELLNDWTPELPEKRPLMFRKMLFLLGADTEHDFEVSFCKHRNRQGQLVKCKRFSFVERTDKQWLSSGFASAEVIEFVYDMNN